MKEKTILKSLHICLDINIRTYDSSFNEILKYTTKSEPQSLFNEVALIKKIKKELDRDRHFILTNISNNVFLIHCYKDKYYLFGPFRVNYLPSTNALKQFLNEKQIKIKNEGTTYDYNTKIKVYTFEDIKSIVEVVRCLLDFGLEDQCTNHLHIYMDRTNEKIEKRSLNKFFYISDENERQKIDFENRVLNLVKKGSTKILKKSLTNLEGGIMLPNTEDSLRSEKNYSIIVFEKLSQLAIESGMDVIEATIIRDQLIKDNEKANDTTDVIKVRNGAILLFSRKIEEIVDEKLSPFMTAVLQYINKNLYQDLTLSSIAKEFNVSQTTLNLTFKNELGLTVKKYLTNAKMKDAKKLLQQDLSISEISQMLGFADSSHFCKKFKKETGMTPTGYKRKNKLNK